MATLGNHWQNQTLFVHPAGFTIEHLSGDQGGARVSEYTSWWFSSTIDGSWRTCEAVKDEPPTFAPHSVRVDP